MKTLLIIAASLIGGTIVWRFLSPPKPATGLLTQDQKNSINNNTLWAYQMIMPPIAQLDRVPLTNGNLRMVDPVMPNFVYPNGIYQNGG